MLTDSLMTGKRTSHLFTGHSDHPGRSDQARRTLEEGGGVRGGETDERQSRRGGMSVGPEFQSSDARFPNLL